MPAATYIWSPNKHDGRLSPIRLVVIHTGETPEGNTAAEGMGEWFSRLSTKASAHKGVDPDSVCRYVADEDTAWAAPGANADGLQIELAGRAGQTTGDWTDITSQRILENAAAEVALWCRRFDIPARWLTDAQLADGHTKGLTTHAQVTRVFKRSDHTDPGRNFPATRFLSRVQQLAKVAPPRTPTVKAATFPGTVRLGDHSPAVRTWQRALNKYGLRVGNYHGYQLTVDGNFGPRTQDAVLDVQRRNRLTRDGIAGRNTWAAITK